MKKSLLPDEITASLVVNYCLGIYAGDSKKSGVPMGFSPITIVKPGLKPFDFIMHSLLYRAGQCFQINLNQWG